VSDTALAFRVFGDATGLHDRLERERSKMTPPVFLPAGSGLVPHPGDRPSRARAATPRPWRIPIAAGVWGGMGKAPPHPAGAV